MEERNRNVKLFPIYKMISWDLLFFYAIIFLYINNLVLDKVLLGISNNKAFYIITTKEEEIKEYILTNFNIFCKVRLP